MTLKITFWIVTVLVAFFVLDHYVLHWNAAVFLGRQMLVLIDVLAIWR